MIFKEKLQFGLHLHGLHLFRLKELSRFEGRLRGSTSRRLEGSGLAAGCKITIWFLLYIVLADSGPPLERNKEPHACSHFLGKGVLCWHIPEKTLEWGVSPLKCTGYHFPRCSGDGERA